MAAGSSSISRDGASASSSSTSKPDEEDAALMILLNSFGSIFSLEDIASAYWKSGHNVHRAGEILSGMLGNTSYGANSASYGETESVISGESYGSSEASFGNGDTNFKVSKVKQKSAVMGSVSGVIGKSYVKSTPWASETQNGTKPLKLEVNMSEDPIKESSVKKDAILQKDVEDFLFEMLGHGFQLDRDVVRDVLGHCGYDVEKSLDELLDLTTKDLEDGDNFLKGTKQDPCLQNSSSIQSLKSTKSIVETSGIEVSRALEKKREQEKEILTALFFVPERPKSPQRTRIIPKRRNTRPWPVVTEPLRDSVEEEHKSDRESEKISTHQDNGEDENEDTYLALRQAVKEYRTTMKEYYKAAAEAFAKGDRTQANKLMEQGKFFFKRACDADEESAQKIFVISGSEVETEDLSLDLQAQDAKEAIRLVKCHLRTLSGITSIKHLKIITGTEDDSATAARKRLVRKLLEKESIKWTEDETSGTIVIQLDIINPKRLSFAKK